jgi:hypothetical protein
MTKENLQKTIEYQKEYIALLERVAKEQAVFLFNHAYLPENADIEAGILLREKIKLSEQI